MILITSAAYVTPGLMAEFGKLPPCMLPVQNRRLYWHQYQLLKSLGEDIVISLPKDFIADQHDIVFFQDHGIQIVYVPNKLTLGASVVYVLNVLGRTNEPLHILHGDTLISKVPNGKDIFAVSTAKDNYSWAHINGLDKDNVLVGYFSFTSQSDLIRNITEQGNNFVEGLSAYSKEHNIKYAPVKNWLDFGLTNSYYRSKSKMTTQRVFNGLKIDRYSVTKSSSDINKMKAEANWIAKVPKCMKHYVPALWDEKDTKDVGEYTIEYFYLSSLSDIFVFGRNPFFILKDVVDACINYIDDESKINPDDLDSIAHMSLGLYGPKTSKRIGEYSSIKNIDLNHSWIINGIKVPSINDILVDINKDLDKPAPEFIHMMHGDFCFSNILYDFKSQSIKVLDPRGRDLNGNITIYGDIRYDVAKFAHSILGLYDYIIGGNYECENQREYNLSLSFSLNDSIKEVQQYFKKQQIAGYTLSQLRTYPILVHLFLSMIPLHSDHPERQQAMLANALRLYAEYKNLN